MTPEPRRCRGLVGGALLAVAASSSAQQPSPATTAPLDLTIGGPLRVEAGRALRLHVPIRDVSAFWRRVGTVAHQLSPAAPLGPSPATTAPVDVVLKWWDGATSPTTIPFRNAVAEVKVAAGTARAGCYSLSWTDPAGRLAIELPGTGRGYPVEIVAPGPTTVLAGSGSQELVVFGEGVPVLVDLQDSRGVRAVTLSHRSVDSGGFTTAAMKLESGDEERGTWKYEVPRPQSVDSVLEYFVSIENKVGGRTSFGSARMPFRISLPDQTSQP